MARNIKWEPFFPMHFAFFSYGNSVLIHLWQLAKLLYFLLFRAVFGLSRNCGFVVSWLTLTVPSPTARLLWQFITPCWHHWLHVLTALCFLLPSLPNYRLLPLFVSTWPVVISLSHRLFLCFIDFFSSRWLFVVFFFLQTNSSNVIFFSARKHRLLTLISFSLLYSVAATLGFHSRSVASSFLVCIFLSFFYFLLKADFKDLCTMDFALPSFFFNLGSYQTAKKRTKRTCMLLSRPAQQACHGCAHRLCCLFLLQVHRSITQWYAS